MFPAVLTPQGYKLDISTAYPDGLTNYTSMISQFKNHGDDFFTNVPLPPDFATMWTQALQQGFKPKLATVAKVLLFPTDAYAMGSKVYNIATDAWWVPTLPWHSSLTGDTCPQLAAAFTAAGLGQPNQNISNYTLFEVAYAAFQMVDNPHDKKALAAALFQVKLPEAIAGPLDYTSTNPKTNPAPGVADHPAGRHPVAEGHQVPARGQGRRQHAAAQHARSTATCCRPTPSQPLPRAAAPLRLAVVHPGPSASRHGGGPGPARHGESQDRVGLAGLEPATSCTQSTRASQTALQPVYHRECTVPATAGRPASPAISQAVQAGAAAGAPALGAVNRRRRS